MRRVVSRSTMLVALVIAAQPAWALDDRSFAYEVPEGSSVVLREPLNVAVGRAAAFLQSGRQIGKNEGDKFLPTCRFRIKGDKDAARVIAPDSFRVTRVRRDYRIVGAPGRWLVAGPMTAGADPTYEIYGVHLELESAKQPAVWRLTCEELYGWGDFSAWHITLGRVREALGNVVEIRLAE